MMGKPDLMDLADDINANGLREPIWIHRDGRIIDGRNRFQACALASLEPTYREYEGKDSDLPAFVVSLNLRRRHLNESQRAMVAAAIAMLGKGRPGNAPIGAFKQDAVGKLLDVGRRSVQRAKKVRGKGTPELKQAVEDGRMSVALASTIADAPPDEQRDAIKGRQKAMQARVKAKVAPDLPADNSAESLIPTMDHCLMRVRAAILETMEEMSQAEWPGLLAAVRDEIDDIERVAQNRPSERRADA
jgi:ParB-like chromosome segregation protein Spo0J